MAEVADEQGSIGREGLPAAVERMHRPSKVGYLQVTLHAQEQILRLDVAMDDML